MAPTLVGERYGFETADIRQEEAIGVLLAERKHPGNKQVSRDRAKVRAARHRKKERAWNNLRIPIREVDRTVEGLQFERALIHEILDLLPYATKEEVLKALLEGDGRQMRRVGRIVRELIPYLNKD